jgi:hypothetical protein
VQKLEALLTDGSGLKPHSPEWQAYWEQKLARIAIGDEPGEPGCIPHEAWDALTVAD